MGAIWVYSAGASAVGRISASLVIPKRTDCESPGQPPPDSPGYGQPVRSGARIERVGGYNRNVARAITTHGFGLWAGVTDHQERGPTEANSSVWEPEQRK